MYSNGDGGQSIEAPIVQPAGPTPWAVPGARVRSSLCSADEGQCVEAEAASPDAVIITDSKMGADSPRLSYTRAEWDTFVAGVKNGEFDFDVLYAAAERAHGTKVRATESLAAL